MQSIRAAKAADVEALKEVLNTIELFPAEYLEDMMSDYLTNPETEDIWFTTTENDKPISLGYCAPEKFTEGTFNLYAIGVKKEKQGKGLGGKMMQYLENQLKTAGHRVLIVETSSAPELKLTREFYPKQAYKQVAVLPDFWSEGEDKVIFWKKL